MSASLRVSSLRRQYSLTLVFINTRVISSSPPPHPAIIVIVEPVVESSHIVVSPVISSLSRRRRARTHMRTLTLPYTCTLVDLSTRVCTRMLDTLVCWARFSTSASAPAAAVVSMSRDAVSSPHHLSVCLWLKKVEGFTLGFKIR